MGVPKRRTSRAKRDKRRTHKRIDPPNLSTCPQCNEPLLPHNVCKHCGYYKGREIIPIEE